MKSATDILFSAKSAPANVRSHPISPKKTVKKILRHFVNKRPNFFTSEKLID